MDGINSVGPLQGAAAPRAAGPAFQRQGGAGVSFKDVMKGVMNDVNEKGQHVDESIKKMESGKITDVNQVMMASEEATAAIDMMRDIKKQMMDAYQEVRLIIGEVS